MSENALSRTCPASRPCVGSSPARLAAADSRDVFRAVSENKRQAWPAVCRRQHRSGARSSTSRHRCDQADDACIGERASARAALPDPTARDDQRKSHSAGARCIRCIGMSCARDRRKLAQRRCRDEADAAARVNPRGVVASGEARSPTRRRHARATSCKLWLRTRVMRGKRGVARAARAAARRLRCATIACMQRLVGLGTRTRTSARGACNE
jgi:hypothetical protein